MVDALFERLVGPGEVIIRWAWPALSSAASRLTVKHAAGWVVCHCAPAALQPVRRLPLAVCVGRARLPTQL